jgi:hypothetical protein
MRPLLLASLFAVTTPAFAQTAPPPQVSAARQACAVDLQRYCAGVEPGGGRIVQCLQRNATQLSEGCRSALVAAQAARR